MTTHNRGQARSHAPTIAPHAERQFIPAAGRDLFLPFYDLLTRLLGARALIGRLLQSAELAAGQRVLDVGCGTGTLLGLLARIAHGTIATGLDPDPKALARARRKAPAATLDRGYADALPYPDASFDRVFSTLMLHHLDVGAQSAALAEMARVLKPDGVLFVLDFAGHAPRDDGTLARALHRDDALTANYSGGLARRITAAGFADVTELGHARTLLGGVMWYRAAPLR